MAMVVSVVNGPTTVHNYLKRVFRIGFSSSDDLACEPARNQRPLILLSYLTLLCIPLLLFTFRWLDDNRLVSWVWGFSQSQFFSLLAVLALVLSFVMVLLFVIENKQWRISENVVSLTFVSFLMSMPFWQIPEIIIDSARYFTQAKYVALNGVGYFTEQWGGTIFAWTDLPLLPLLYGLAFKFFGEHRTVIQVLGSVFYAGTVAATYLLGKTLWDHNHGFAAAVLLLGIPYLYTQIPLMMVDIPTMFFLTVAVLASVMALKSGGFSHIVFAAMAIVLALFTKYSAWLFLSVVPFTVLVQPLSDWRKSLITLCKIGLVVAVFMLIALYWYFPVLVEQIHILLNYQWGALGRWQEGNLSTFLFHVHPLISLAAILSLFFALKNRDIKFLLVSWMLIPIIVLDIQRIRYVMVVFPMLALMAGYAVMRIPNVTLKRFGLVGVVLTSYSIVLFMSTGFLQNTSASNIKSAGELLNSLGVEFVEVVVLPQQRSVVNPQISVAALDYHTTKTLLYNHADPLNSFGEISDISDSPVRFTWEYSIPPFYHNTREIDKIQKAIAVVYSDEQQIASKQLQTRLVNYHLIKQFAAQTGAFKYKTLINLYVPN
jgi:4-amino-4-deoxy-L-arabinose transferase-like glycosyltransferase